MSESTNPSGPNGDDEESGGDHYGDPLARNSDPDTSHDAADSVRSRVRAQKARLETQFANVYPEPLIAYEAAELAGLTGREDGACHWHRVTDLVHEGKCKRLPDTRLCKATGRQQLLTQWVPPVERISPVDLAKRRQTLRSPQMATALTVVGDVRDGLRLLASRTPAPHRREALTIVADRLTEALALAPGFRDWEAQQ